jgi:hypothetical protein
MAIPDYFGRNAVAIAQAISGSDEKRLQTMLSDVCVGVTLGSDAGGSEGRAAVDLLIRLLARLYPAMAVRDESDSGADREAAELARRVNPKINLSQKPTTEVAIGLVSGGRSTHRTVFAGCSGWTASLSGRVPQACGSSNNPFGAGLTACLASADVFRHVFLPGTELDHDLELTIPVASVAAAEDGDVTGHVGSLVLAGAGAVGNATAWALSRAQVFGSIEIVDDESIDLGNLQRYVLAERDAENKPKAEFVASKFAGTLTAEAYGYRLAEFLEKKSSRTDVLLLALDSANDRRAAQASLPRRICNAWTQPGDVGVSVHNFTNGACVSCLYLPEGQQNSEDVIIAEAFGVSDRLMEVRSLLHKGEGAPKSLLEAIAGARGIKLEKLLPFEGRLLRDLYSEGFCGGAVIPLEEMGFPADDVHVPLAHQSALAGVLLAASAVTLGQSEPDRSMIAQLDVLKPQGPFQVYPVAKDARGRCICQDSDYVEVYQAKYNVIP